ncbi:sulfite exporter TauE/SafE family protein [Massilia aurea]|uniref:sulfite exporter TauE/SafE family protein n=1 Tax=Massilia aurea TaxID=373040 RepID=UPI003461BA60
MDPSFDPLLILALLAMGTFGGFVAGLLGVGGGMVLVPFITMLFTARGFPDDLVVHMAIATSLGMIFFTSMSSVRAHHKHGAVLWPIVRRFTPGILIGAWVGPWIGKQMNTSALAFFFGCFVAFSAIQMLIGKKPAAARELPGTAGMFAAGGVIGILAGLVGAGGAFVSVPFMARCNVRIHNAVATSAALGFPVALMGTLSNVYYGWGEPGLPAWSLGFVYLPALAIIVLASVSMAPLGARTAHRMPVRQLQRIFAVILLALATYMFWKAFN